MASIGSTAPVLVVPAEENTMKGVSPAARSAAIAACEEVDAHPVVGIDVDGAHAIVRDAGELRRLHDAVMRLREVT
jgi:hypothetical protein